MAAVLPFRALRPPPRFAAQVASVPYDVVDRDEAAALAAGNPLSFLHVVRPEIDLPAEADPKSDEAYAGAAAALARLVAAGALADDDGEALYLYRLTRGAHAQVGVVGCCPVADYDGDRIKKHERTRPDKEDDRVRLALATGAHTGPVFLTYRGSSEIDRLVSEATSASGPLYDFTAPDGVGHQVWRVAGGGELAAAFAAVDALYVADGHHRAAAASRVRAAVGDGGGDAPCAGTAGVFLAVLFPAEQVLILPYNRLVHDLAGLTPEAFLARLGEVVAIGEGNSPEPAARGRVSMYLAGRWHDLAVPPAALAGDDPVATIDAAILQDLVLGPILGIADPRTSERIDFIGGGRGTAELARRVDARPGSVAFSLHPIGVEQLLAVADAGRVLPPKSTWFEPKLRSGLLVHRFGPRLP